jgi:formamidopyrimidine-DNA glycosylase
MPGMPELPEVAAHAERLSAAYTGGELTRFEALSFTALKTFDPPPDAAVGRTLDGITHRGKHLLLRFGDVTYVVHLMQGGRLKPDGGKARRPKIGVARWTFDPATVPGSHASLMLSEAGAERRAGVWVVGGDPHGHPPLGELGPDADGITADELAALLAANPMRLHTLLRDQRLLAGLGRRLANEVCHRARLSPFARTSSLDPAEAEAVHRAIRELVAEGLADERAQTEMRPSRERLAAVHGRTGEPCPDCDDLVREVAYNRYTVHYCATCQTGGKVLADNTLSKLGIDRDEQGLGPGGGRRSSGPSDPA